MITNCKFHHMGYTVDDIQSTVAQFVAWGYQAGDAVYDEGLTVDLCYLIKAGCPTIELVHQRNQSSLETSLLRKNGVMPYHLGYETDDMDVACAELEVLGYARLFDPVPVRALNGIRICYFHHPLMGYVELLEPSGI